MRQPGAWIRVPVDIGDSSRLATVWLDCLISPPRLRSTCAMSFLPSHTALHSGVIPHLSTGDTGTLSDSRKVTMSSLPSETATCSGVRKS